MKYKICEYVNGKNTHTWRIKYRFNWFPIWFTLTDYWYGGNVSFYSREDAIKKIHALKIYDLATTHKRIKCEIV